jgi:hypothetical protein
MLKTVSCEGYVTSELNFEVQIHYNSLLQENH